LTASLCIEIWKFGENDLMQIWTLQCITHYIFKCSINPLAFLFVNDIMVTYNLVAFLAFHPFIRFFENTCTWLCISNTNLSFPNHVHFIHFLILIVNNHVFSVISEPSWYQTSCNIINKSIILDSTSWIFGVIEEPSISTYHIRKQILNSYFRFDFHRKVFDIDIRFICEVLVSIFFHVEIIIIFDCIHYWWRKWLPISESL